MNLCSICLVVLCYRVRLLRMLTSLLVHGRLLAARFIVVYSRLWTLTRLTGRPSACRFRSVSLVCSALSSLWSVDLCETVLVMVELKRCPVLISRSCRLVICVVRV